MEADQSLVDSESWGLRTRTSRYRGSFNDSRSNKVEPNSHELRILQHRQAKTLESKVVCERRRVKLQTEQTLTWDTERGSKSGDQHQFSIFLV